MMQRGRGAGRAGGKCRVVSMHPILRLYEDVLSNADDRPAELAALPRMIFIVHGSATIQGRAFSDGEVWHGEDAVTVTPGTAGVTWWRFELAPGDAADGNV